MHSAGGNQLLRYVIMFVGDKLVNFFSTLQWVPQDVLSSPISSAAYSCNSQLIYATFTDGSIGVFDADSLRLRCRIAPSAYMSQASPNRYFKHCLHGFPWLPPPCVPS